MRVLFDGNERGGEDGLEGSLPRFKKQIREHEAKHTLRLRSREKWAFYFVLPDVLVLGSNELGYILYAG
jgi:hypothetical protein